MAKTKGITQSCMIIFLKQCVLCILFRYIFATQMEPAAARKVFPCADEPSQKATFTLALTVPVSFEAISNGPASKIMSSDGGTLKVMVLSLPTCHF